MTLLLAFGTGLKKQMIKSTAGLGDRICIAWPGLTSIPYQGLGKGRRIRLIEEDVEAIRREAEGLSGVSSEYDTSMKLHLDLKTWPVDVSGVSPEFGRMRNLIPQAGGRFIDPVDMAEQRRVVFLGDKLAANIFGKAEDAVGKDRHARELAVPRDRRPPDEDAGLELQRARQRQGLDPRHDVPRADRREVREQHDLPGDVELRHGASQDADPRDPRQAEEVRPRRTRRPCPCGTRRASSSSGTRSCSRSRGSSASSARSRSSSAGSASRTS